MLNNKSGWLNAESPATSTATSPMHNTEEPEAPFPTLALMSVMLVFFIAAILNGSMVMLVSALLPTPLLLWRLFVTLDEWEARRSAMNPVATATTDHAASPATTADPQPTTI